MKPYIIVTPTYSHFFNGVRVLHTLCDELNRCGREAFLLFFGYPEGSKNAFLFSIPNQPKFYCKELTHIKMLPPSISPADDFRELIDRAYVIYPESIEGNPLNAKHIVRYLLADPRKKDFPCDYGADEFIISYAANLWEKPDCLLTIMFDEPVLNDNNTLPYHLRRMNCTYVGKGFKYGDCIQIPGSVMVERQWPADKESLAVLLRNTRYFFTWDVVTETNTDAIKCGAIPVIMRWAPFNPQLMKIEGIDTPYAEAILMDGRLNIVFDKASYDAKRETLIKHFRTVAATRLQRVEETAARIERRFASMI